MKKHPTSRTGRKSVHPFIFLSEKGQVYEFPKSVVVKLSSYIMTDNGLVEKAKEKFEKIISFTPEEIYSEMNRKFTRPGALLKGVRIRENLNQKDFAEKIEVQQGDLSKMESGKRPIGKIIARRIAKKFNVNYKFFL